jgi:hypothetical protein
VADSVEVFITENLRSTDWGLRPPLDFGVFSLIGWRVRPEPVDGGAPPLVAALLCRAICDFATVSFLSGDRSAPPFSLASTTDPAIASRLFDEANYPWTQHGQIALLSPHNAGPPVLARRQIRELHEQRNPGVAKRAGFTGVLLPGVDGDVAGLWVFDPVAKRRLMDALRNQCVAAGCRLEVLPEEMFRKKLLQSS